MLMRSLLLVSTLGVALIAPATSQPANPPTPSTSSPALVLPLAPAASPVPSTTDPSTPDMFFTDAGQTTHWRSSETIGQAVYNRTGERIGEVDELLIDSSGRILAAVIGVGGFLGIGERSVAVSFRALELMRGSDGKPRLVINLDKGALKNAPDYNPVLASKRS